MYDQATLAAQLQRLLSLEGTEAEEDALIAEIGANVADPAWMDQIYQSRAFETADGTIDLQAASAHILSYKAIQL